jgi:DNA-binding MarR family transcriptional regulator
MIHAWQKVQRTCAPTAAMVLPPATIEEAAWDILLALHSGRCRGLGLDRLANLVSLSRPALHVWLARLEEGNLVTGIRHEELWAVLTTAGRELLERYWSAASGLQVGASH